MKRHSRRFLLVVALLVVLFGAHVWVELAFEQQGLKTQLQARAAVEATTGFRRALQSSYLGVVEWHLAVGPERQEREAQLRSLLVALEASAAQVAPFAGRVPGLEAPRLSGLLADAHAFAAAVRAELHLGGAALPLEALRAHFERVRSRADVVVQACVSADGALERHLAELQARHDAVNVGIFFSEALSIAAALYLWARRERLERRVNAAEQARAELRQMAASVAHEVNNQLGVLHNTLELARRGAPPAELLPFQEESFEQIRRLAADLVTFSSSHDGERSRFDLSELARSVARGVAADVTVHAQDSVWMWADKAALARALLNLVKNGVEAGGPVELQVERAQGGVRVRCLDQGAGISPEHAGRLGSPFFTTKARGTGLGLAIIQRVATSHGGRFLLANRQGRGAVAELWLPPGPALERQEPPDEQPLAGAAGQRSG